MTGVFLWSVVTLLVSVYPRAKVQEKQASNFTRACVPPRYGMAAYKVIDYSLFGLTAVCFVNFFTARHRGTTKRASSSENEHFIAIKKIAVYALFQRLFVIFGYGSINM
jgi:hypothetical protein